MTGRPRTQATLAFALAFAIVLTIGGCAFVRFAVHGTPPAVVERSTLPACGQESTDQTDGYDVVARQCFWTAYLQGRPAEFMTTRLSIEGDPITWIYRVLSPGHLEVFIDSTQDRYSPRTWLKLTCSTLGLIDAGLVTPDFGPDDSCTETTIG